MEAAPATAPTEPRHVPGPARAAEPRRAAHRRAFRSGAHAAVSRAPGGRVWWIVGALTLAALLVRIPGLGDGLWADEIYSLLHSFRTPLPAALAEFPGDNKHPFYALLAHASLAAFGESAWSVRLPALLFGAATVPLLFALGRRVTSRAEALAAAALLAFSYHHVWFSQNARGYSALAFWAVLTTLLFLRAADGGGYRAWIAYGAAAGLGAYTHLTFVFTVAAQAVVAALALAGWPAKERRLPWRQVLTGFAVAGALALVLYAPMLGDVLAFFLHRESNLKGVSSPGWALGETLRVLRIGFGGALLGLVVLTAGAAVGLAGVASYARQSGRVLLLLTLPAFTTLLGALLARGTMYPRFFFLLAGFALLIGMRGAFVAGGWVARRLGKPEAAGFGIATAMVALVVLASAGSIPLDWRAPKQDYEGAMRFVERARRDGDLIATTDVTAEIYGAYYGKGWPAVKTAGELSALRSARPPGGAVWLLYTFPRYLERYGDGSLSGAVARDCVGERVRAFAGTVGGGDVMVCRLSGGA